MLDLFGVGRQQEIHQHQRQADQTRVQRALPSPSSDITRAYEQNYYGIIMQVATGLSRNTLSRKC